MTAIIPVVWRATQATESTPGSDYFFKSTISDKKNVFQSLGISKETVQNITKMVKTESRGQEDKILEAVQNADLTKNILEQDENFEQDLLLPSFEGVFVTLDEPKGVILRIWKNCFIIIAKDIDTGMKINEKIKVDFDNLNKVTKDFELELTEYLTGKDYAMTMLTKSDIKFTSVNFTIPKNDFEQEILHEVEKLTNCLLNNVEIKFEEPTETFEYDILVPISDNEIVDIEVTDYETAKGKAYENLDTLKSQLILSTLDKSQRLKANCIIIAKGFPENIFNQMKEVATSRNITLLNEVNYKQNLEKIIFENFLKEHKEYSGRTMLRQRRAFRSVRGVSIPRAYPRVVSDA